MPKDFINNIADYSGISVNNKPINSTVYQNQVKLLTKILKYNPKHFQAYCDLGFTHLAAGEMKLALKNFEIAIGFNNHCALAFYGRGHTRMALGDYKLGLADYERVVFLEPGFVGAYYHRGITYLINKKMELALEDLNQVLMLDAKHINALYARSYLYFKLDNQDAALKDHGRAWDLDEQAKNGLDYPTGIKDIFSQLELAPNKETKLLNLYRQEAKHYAHLGERYQEELAGLEHVEKKLAQGNQALLDDNFEQALAHYNAVLNETAHHVEALYRKAFVYEKLDRTNEALSLYKKVALMCIDADDAQDLLYQDKAKVAKKRLEDCLASSSTSSSPLRERFFSAFPKLSSSPPTNAKINGVVSKPSLVGSIKG